MLQKLICLAFLTVLFIPSFAATYAIPDRGNVVGELQYIHAEPGDTLGEVGLRFNMGYNEMVRANPSVDPNSVLAYRQRLLVPSQFILPSVPHNGLIINLAEYRLYYFPHNDNVVMTYPVGIGRKGWNTPLGLTRVVSKGVNPSWRPSAKLQAEAYKHGVLLPDMYPSGLGNPLGKHVLRLGWPTYLIHGTNHADGVGMRVSAGCIRMLPDDIDYLFNIVEVGTPVRVINQIPSRVHGSN